MKSTRLLACALAILLAGCSSGGNGSGMDVSVSTDGTGQDKRTASDAVKEAGQPDTLADSSSDVQSGELPRLVEDVAPAGDADAEAAEVTQPAEEVVEVEAEVAAEIVVCAPQCEDMECGDDGCDGSCGECSVDNYEVCDAGACVCDAEEGFHLSGDGESCTDDPCDPDPCADEENMQCASGACFCIGFECNGECCAEGLTCFEDACCQPQCEGVDCGPDECGSVCGHCLESQVCEEGQCSLAVGACELCQSQCQGVYSGCMNTCNGQYGGCASSCSGQMSSCMQGCQGNPQCMSSCQGQYSSCMGQCNSQKGGCMSGCSSVMNQCNAACPC